MQKKSEIGKTETILQLFSKITTEQQQEVLELFKEQKLPATNAIFRAFLINLCKKEFKWFVILFVQEIVGSSFEFALHCEILCAFCQKHSENQLKYPNDAIINIPPGHSKTTICNVLYSAWLLGNDTRKRIIVRTTSDSMATETNQQTAEILTSVAFIECFGDIVASTTQEKISLKNVGYRKSSSMLSRVTGENADVLIVDDPNDAGCDIQTSSAEIETIRKTYFQKLKTRLRGESYGLQPLIIQQRVNTFDLTGNILELARDSKQPVNHLCLREEESNDITIAIHCKNKKNDTHFKRPKGYLWVPKEEKRREMRLTMLETFKAQTNLWVTQYQQNPSEAKQAYFQMEYFKWYSCEVEELPIVSMFITCDYAVKIEDNHDRTCLCCWGMSRDGNLYLIDILFNRFEASELVNKTIEFYNRNKIRTFKRYQTNSYGDNITEEVWCNAFYIEENYNESKIDEFKKRNAIGGLKVLQRKRNASKEERFENALTVIAPAPIIYFPEKRFYTEMNLVREELRELSPVTLGLAHDDFIDNMCDAVNEGRTPAMKIYNLLNSNIDNYNEDYQPLSWGETN